MKMKQKLTIIVLTIVAIVFIFGCKTSQDATQPGPNPTDPNTVTIRDNSFSPSSLTVDPGTTVRWVNNGSMTHTVTSGTRNNPSGLFDSGDMRNGNTFEFTFMSSGTFSYFCMHHVGMDGTIIVR
jgi:plastocyanin